MTKEEKEGFFSYYLCQVVKFEKWSFHVCVHKLYSPGFVCDHKLTTKMIFSGYTTLHNPWSFFLLNGCEPQDQSTAHSREFFRSITMITDVCLDVCLRLKEVEAIGKLALIRASSQTMVNCSCLFSVVIKT